MKYLYALNVLKTQCVCTVVHQKLHRHWNYGKIQTDACASSKSMDRLTIIRCISRNYLLFQDRISRGEKKPTTQSFPGDRHKRRIRSIQSSRNTKFNLNSYSSFSTRFLFGSSWNSFGGRVLLFPGLSFEKWKRFRRIGVSMSSDYRYYLVS